MTSSSKSSLPETRRVPILLTSILIIAICGILYELLISTISSYFQGSSILHFSIIIGLFLSFMGVGSYVSRYVKRSLLKRFIQFEILLAIVGGASSFLLYFAYALTPYYYVVVFLLIAILGSLIGLEIPILTRIVSKYENLKDAMASVLSFDYLGSLIASIAFPLILLPFLGIMRTAFAIGLLNLLVAGLNLWLFRDELKNVREMMIVCVGVGIFLLAGFVYSFQISGFFEQFLYRNPIILTEQTSYQRIIVTQHNQDTRLFIDGNIQFSSRDEFRYHEPLVHIPIALSINPKHILIMGGGDGLAVRELLKHPMDSIKVVDLDPAMTKLGKTHPIFTRLNQHALSNEKVKIFNEDAFKFIEQTSDIYDLIIIDLPDPNNVSLGKLYSQEFYHMVESRLAAGGAVVTQSTSPYFARDAFWCIHHTMEAVFPETLPYTVQVPSFGQWGFNLSVKRPGKLSPSVPDGIPLEDQAVMAIQKHLFQSNPDISFQFLNSQILTGLFDFGEDTKEVPTEINRIDNQQLVQYYEASWKKWE